MSDSGLDLSLLFFGCNYIYTYIYIYIIYNKGDLNVGSPLWGELDNGIEPYDY